jgi:tRNA A-37 threonylcarbamoyl transferase component Bud32
MSIERRIGPVPFQFMFADRRRYTIADDYKPSAEYYDQVSRLTPEDWEIVRSGAWWSCFPPRARLPDSGFKIHISASLSNAPMVLETVAKECALRLLPFKFLVDRSLHNFANSKNYSEWSCGKFVTLYPADEVQFHEVAMTLSEALPDAGGPYIFSDAPVSGSSAVYFRYGVFQSSTEVNIYGEAEQSFKVKGETYLDQSNPAFSLPAGVPNPFAHGNSQSVRSIDGALVLSDRYEVTEIIHRSNSGAVFCAIDLASNEEVVVKEARHGITSSGMLAKEILRNEFELLQFLSDSKVPPSPIDYFQLAKNEFLVMEKIDGIPLTKYRASSIPTNLHRFSATSNDEDAAKLVFESTLDNLLNAIDKIHAKGIVIGDLAPQNILINEADFKVRIVDFEAARHSSSQQTIRTRTIGYGSDIGGGYESDREAALSSLVNVMLPLQAGAELNPRLIPRFLSRVSRDYPKLSALCQDWKPDKRQ